MVTKYIFWICLGIIIYTYLVYVLILFLLILVKKNNKQKIEYNNIYKPEVSLLVPSYNEKNCIERKVNNSLQIDYPPDKLHLIWVTDGSDDGSEEILQKYKKVKVYHEKERKGKINAMNRSIKFIKTPIVIFSDANTDLNKNAVNEIVKSFQDTKVGCVAGEKRIYVKSKEKAVSAGENIYWKYESLVKKLESDLHSTVGAAGELFALRTDLYEKIKEDTILDDFAISLVIAKKGYKIKYEPQAYACESASLSIKEELKRKIRIASGGFQTLFRMIEMLNIFKYGILSFQFFSHKVIRWTLMPISFLVVFVTNLMIVFGLSENYLVYKITLLSQILFYILVLIGLLVRNLQIRFKLLFVPYYLFIMNYSIILGMIRYLEGKHTALWEKTKRARL